MGRTLGLIFAALIGGGVAYYLDPRNGKRRRHVTRDKLVHAARSGQRAIEHSLVDANLRTHGAAHEIKVRMSPDDADSDVIAQRVRAKLGHVTNDAHRIEVKLENGRVTLAGPCEEHDIPNVLHAIRGVRGVDNVTSQLEPYASTEPRPEPRHVWTPMKRLFVGIGGAAAIGFAFRDSNPIRRTILGMLGSGVLVRSLTNLDFAKLTGINAGPRVIDIEKTVHIEAPLDQVYALWQQMEKFPLFMSHVEKVTRNEDGTYHWKVRGPSWLELDWDAIVTEDIPNEKISWVSKENAPVKQTGTVRFEREGLSRTTVHVTLSYNPPAGAIGHVVARLFGADPRSQMDDDLLRLKSLLERGRATGHRTVTLDEVMH